MDRRAFCTRLSASALVFPAAGGPVPRTVAEKAAGVTPVDLHFPPGNVCRYGADPTGAKDSTAAFNAATFHDLEYSLEGLLNDIVVPSGTFKLDGTVYVRKGQRLHGAYAATRIICNNSGKGPTFKLGWRFNGTRAEPDPGGQPLSLESLFLLGGPTAGCIDCTRVAGAVLKDLFISASALAMRIDASADLNVENVIFDQGQVGIDIVGSENCQFSLLKFYLLNYDVSVGAGAVDCQWSNCHSEYNRYSSILFAERAEGIRDLKFTDWQFVYNPTSRAHYTTFAGAIHNRAPEVDARFDGCAFSNMPGYAYVHGTATGSRLRFSNCVFDGNRTSSTYSRSTAAGALAIQDEAVSLDACTFRDLAVTPIRVGGAALTVLEINGGDYARNGGECFMEISNRSGDSGVRVAGLKGDARQPLLNSQPAVPVSVRNCADWFGPPRTSGERRSVLVPCQTGSLYQIVLHAEIPSRSGARVRVSEMFVARILTTTDRGSSIKIQNATDRAADGGETVAMRIEFAPSEALAISWSAVCSAERLSIDMS